jgi:predicted nucleic acid-binding protein
MHPPEGSRTVKSGKDEVRERKVRGYLAAHTTTTLFYLLQKGLGAKRARKALSDLLRIVDIVAVDEDRIRHALAMGWTDFEDAVQAACAEKAEVDYLVTRDKAAFRRAAVRVLSPSEFFAVYVGT